jgi:triacylglycerol lipase
MSIFTQNFHQDFQTASTAHSLFNARLLAIASKLAYENAETVKTVTRSWGFDENRFLFLDRSGTQGFVACSDTLCLLAFRGTTSVNDWLFNIHVRLDGNLHSGFHAAYNAVRMDLHNHLNAHVAPKGIPLWITGHSLGGALARIAAMNLLDSGIATPRGVYTFGQPRTGNAAFIRECAAKLNGLTFRYVHAEDIVPRVPSHIEADLDFVSENLLKLIPGLENLDFGYSHDNARFFIPKNGKAAQEPDSDPKFDRAKLARIMKLIASLKVAAATRLAPVEVQDHHIDRYIEGCQ